MRFSIYAPVLAAAISVLVSGSVASVEELDRDADALNCRIVAAIADGREWPKFPGGLAGFLFGQDSVFGRGVIYDATEAVADSSSGVWREVAISQISDGTWRIMSIRECDESDVREWIERRDFHRKSSVEQTGLDYVRQGPLELLDLLRSWEKNYWLSPIMPFGWVKESELPALVELLDSPEPCANVQSPLSSYIDMSRSTIGNEAAYLIEGFRRDRYPPRLNSTRPACDIDEIKAWWKQRGGT